MNYGETTTDIAAPVTAIGVWAGVVEEPGDLLGSGHVIAVGRPRPWPDVCRRGWRSEAAGHGQHVTIARSCRSARNLESPPETSSAATRAAGAPASGVRVIISRARAGSVAKAISPGTAAARYLSASVVHDLGMLDPARGPGVVHTARDHQPVAALRPRPPQHELRVEY